MKFSAFAKFGHLRFSGKPSYAETIYRQITGENALGALFDFESGTYEEAFAYSEALSLARAQLEVDRAYNQGDPNLTTDLLPALERDYRLVSMPTDTLPSRRSRLAAQMQISAGATDANIAATLTTALGADFVAYRPAKYSEVTAWPASPGSGPGLFGRPDVAPKTVRLTRSIKDTGSSWFYFEGVGEESDVWLAPGTVLCVQPENLWLAEKVTVGLAYGSNDAMATFTKVHDVGAIITTAPMPIWISRLRTALVIVSASCAADPVKRGTIHAIMRTLSRGVTTWDIVASSSPTAVAQFTVDSALGSATAGPVTFP
jgi:hypothetical protein